MTDRELMRQALEAMGAVGADHICQASHHAKKDQHQWNEPCPLQQRWHIAFQALRERLAQPERRDWQGLTDDEYSRLHDGLYKQGRLFGWVVDQIEAKLKEKNNAN